MPSLARIELSDCFIPGIWLLELAPQLPPTVRLHGVDIITRLFPTTYPSNIKFSVEDVTRLPSSWSNSFTLVHQRLLLAALRKVEWPIAISEMYRVTSPGGWIQLCETGSWRAGPFTARFQSLMRTLLDSKGLFMDCYKAMPLMLRNAGFVDVRVEVIQLSLCGAEGSDDRKFVSIVILYITSLTRVSFLLLPEICVTSFGV